MTIESHVVVVTGAAGFVGKRLVAQLKEDCAAVLAVDRVEAEWIDIVTDVDSLSPLQLPQTTISLVHCAAARTDFGLSPAEYYKDNISATRALLQTLEGTEIIHFCHISSVAAFDGETIAFENSLSTDDAYRCTKYLQEVTIREWCRKFYVPLSVVYPSAIFDPDTARLDTNIGKMAFLARRLPFYPALKVKKSRTNLVKLCSLLSDLVVSRQVGRFLALENPVESVEQIWRGFLPSGSWRFRLPIPYTLLIILADIEGILQFVFRHRPLLTRGRVVKLFRDTSYGWLQIEGLDRSKYEGK